jgi:hypothetical protein
MMDLLVYSIIPISEASRRHPAGDEDFFRHNHHHFPKNGRFISWKIRTSEQMDENWGFSQKKSGLF